MKVYRTDEQWIHMCKNALNGNWTDAAKDCVEFGFYANDMIRKYEEEEFHILDQPTDVALLAEMAANIRGAL